MPLSQNGYTANDRSLIGTYTVPGTSGRVAVRRGDVATILLYVLQRFNREVEKLVWPGIWGYAERTIRGSSTTLSNHASGTAVDANAPRHPLGTNPYNNFSRAQISTIHRIINDCGVKGRPVVRWGGDYFGRKDGMHFEIVGSSADVRTLAARIRSGSAAPVVSAARKRVQSWQRTYLEFASSRCDGLWGKDTEVRSNIMVTAARYADNYTVLNKNSKKSTIQLIQRIIDVSDDGVFGPKSSAATHAWVKKVQAFLGVTADGLWGPKTHAAYTSFRNANYMKF